MSIHGLRINNLWAFSALKLMNYYIYQCNSYESFKFFKIDYTYTIYHLSNIYIIKL